MQRLLSKSITPVLYYAAGFTVVALFILALFHVGMHPALAQQTAFQQFGEASTLPQDSIAIIIARIIRIALSLIGIIFVILIIYAGFLWMTAGGKPDPIEKAKKIIKQGVIGLAIIFSAYSIASWILHRLLEAAYESSTTSIVDAYTEPLSGALGGGILEDHYPARNAVDIPRNTKIFVTFKEPVSLDSMIDGFAEDPTSTDLNVQSVLIYRTEQGVTDTLDPDEVYVAYDDNHEIFVFDPVDYLGSAEEDTNYTVYLTSNIEKENGDTAFTGVYSRGYNWTFEVSTEVDLTPPTVTYTIPQQDAEEPRNVSVELTFSEAMDPVAATGTYYTDVLGEESYYSIISVKDTGDNIVQGTYEISNAYRTVTFTTFDACGEDPCGDPIYCLPGDEDLTVTAKSASVNASDIPQSLYVFADGLVDAAANVLDGDDNYDEEIVGTVCGSETDAVECSDGDPNDDYVWDFSTTNEVDDTVPVIMSLAPGRGEDEIDQSDPVIAVFNVHLKSSTLNTASTSLWPDPMYEMWFAIRKSDEVVPDVTPEGCGDSLDGSCLQIEHPTFVANELGGWNYYPVFTDNIKSSYQICMYPAIGEWIGPVDDAYQCDDEHRSSLPYCCDGVASLTGCITEEDGYDLPYSPEE